MRKLICLLLLLSISAIAFGEEVIRKSRENKSFICQSDSDCVIKDSQCGPGCFHKDQKPQINPKIKCEYRPWFKKERCECLDNKCVKISCEDLGLDYPECNQ